jgi:hypothetical protein
MRIDDKLKELQDLVANHRLGRERGLIRSSHFPAPVRDAAVSLVTSGVAVATVAKKAKLCPRLLNAWCRRSAGQIALESFHSFLARRANFMSGNGVVG